MEEQVIIQQSKTESTALSIKELFFKYVRFLPLYIIFVALSLLGAYMYLRYATEFYSSAGQLVIRDEKNSGGLQDDRFTQMMQADNRKIMQTEIEILQSRPLMERVVEALDL